MQTVGWLFFSSKIVNKQFKHEVIRHKFKKPHVLDHVHFQFSIIIIGGLTSAFAFSFVDLAAFPVDSTSSKVFYGIWIVVIYSIYPGIYSCFAPETMRTFGPQHYSANYGLVFTMNVSIYFLYPGIYSCFVPETMRTFGPQQFGQTSELWALQLRY